MQERFWAKVAKGDGCWLWTGNILRNGYGQISLPSGDRKVSVHRLAWEFANGPIPSGMDVCHRCDVRNCVRPDHLFLGTRRDNIADMVQKGRRARTGKLTDAEVAEVRRLAASGVLQREIAARFGMTQSGISLIVRGRYYSAVPA